MVLGIFVQRRFHWNIECIDFGIQQLHMPHCLCLCKNHSMMLMEALATHYLKLELVVVMVAVLEVVVVIEEGMVVPHLAYNKFNIILLILYLNNCCCC